MVGGYSCGNIGIDLLFSLVVFYWLLPGRCVFFVEILSVDLPFSFVSA